MQLDVSEIKECAVNLELEHPAAHFPILADLEGQSSCRFLSPIKVKLRAEYIGGMVELAGHISTIVELPCSLCLEPCRCELSADFAQSYVDELPQVTGEDGEELELSALEMGLELFEDGQIDLLDEIQQQVIVLLPAGPLCSNNCKGLCSQCGADLNSNKCSCGGVGNNLNFAALKDFKVEKKV